MTSSKILRSTFLAFLLSVVLYSGSALKARPRGAPPQSPSRSQTLPDNPWPGKKKLLAIADPQEWYSSSGYHHDSASHTLATIERLGRETGDWVTVIRTDMRLLTKQRMEGHNVRTLDDFDAIFYMGEGPWNITDQQKADLLSFVHEDGKGFVAGHAGNGGHLLLWPEYAQMIGGNLVGEFPSANLPIIVEDPNFPGVSSFPHEFVFKDQYTIVGPNYSRDIDHVIMRLDSSKFDATFAALQPEKDFGRPVSQEQFRGIFTKLAALRTDRDFPIVWAKQYGKGRVWYSTFGHLEPTMDDKRIQQMYIGAIRWALGLTDADTTPHPQRTATH
ncbi:MAG: ThuA domain-containing protein [Acidobacteriota bacterium]|nr:ThuA domain-containing protein [Acidobacteriota bacterium]MDQ2841031.1 ThuA domain-containing protein [Acidobacteriota bacterium]